jgi:diguanylate cyclase (GGDEF)-like protein
MPDQNPSHFRFSLLLKEIDNLRYTDGVSSIALALIQLDGMEEINERFGYLGGDKVLTEFAVRLAGIVGHKGSTFAISGTSFALLIQNPSDEGDAVSGAKKIAKAASDPVVIGTGKARVHARMGISLFPDPASTAEELLHQCELAIAKARANGETYRVYAPSLDASDGCATKSWFDVDRAIKEREFEIHYQPRMDLRSGRLIGTEALIRWQSPRAGTIPPSYFLPDITSMEGVRTMLRYVLETACENALEWVDRVPDFSLSANLAANNVRDPELVALVGDVLRDRKFPAKRLILEVLEDVFITNDDSVIEQLSRLRDMGVRIAVDDFGTGHLGVTHLKNLPIDQLKIDKSLVVPIPSNDQDRRIVGSLTQLAHALDLEVVAEGIEDGDIMQTLLSIGCELGEGFHFSRPVSKVEFEQNWISKYSRSPAASA